MSRPSALLYALSTCVHCRRMREYLEKNDIGVTCTYVDALSGQDRDAALEKVREANPRLSFPTLIIGDAVVVGFNPEAVQEALSS